MGVHTHTHTHTIRHTSFDNLRSRPKKPTQPLPFIGVTLNFFFFVLSLILLLFFDDKTKKMAVSPETLESAILVMYGTVAPPTPTAQQDAIRWLLDFQETPVSRIILLLESLPLVARARVNPPSSHALCALAGCVDRDAASAGAQLAHCCAVLPC